MMRLQKNEGKHWPKISIITPSYNQGQFLERTILSILGQNYPNLEYMIIDGGSTDNSVEIINKYSDNLAYWVSEPDNGQSHAINKGFKRATGDILGWLNSDDMYFSADVLKNIAVWFQEHPELDACYGHNIYVDENDELLFCRYELPFFSKRILQVWDFVHQPTVFFRDELLQEVGMLDEELHFCMDYDFWLRIVERYRFGPSHQIVSASRWHSWSKTIHNAHKMAKEAEMVLHKRGIKMGLLIRVVRKIGYNFLRLMGISLFWNSEALKSNAMFSLRVSNSRSAWTKQLLGLTANQRLWGSRGTNA